MLVAAISRLLDDAGSAPSARRSGISRPQAALHVRGRYAAQPRPLADRRGCHVLTPPATHANRALASRVGTRLHGQTGPDCVSIATGARPGGTRPLHRRPESPLLRASSSIRACWPP